MLSVLGSRVRGLENDVGDLKEVGGPVVPVPVPLAV